MTKVYFVATSMPNLKTKKSMYTGFKALFIKGLLDTYSYLKL